LIAVRLARPEEYARVGEITIAAYRALPIDHLWGGYEERILDTADRARGAEVLVAVLDGDRVVGSVTYVGDDRSEWGEWIEPGEAQFRLLAVDPAARGLGAGRALVAACVERAAAAARPIVIHTTPWMQTAQRIYERFGFVRRPGRDVPYEVWREDPVTDLPTEWIGRPFLAYAWSPSTRAHFESEETR
jgi:ribosomal protein S18 acetylase RimI-like enzyme